MRLVLEGPDNAGKTTLASNIVQKCPHVVYKHAGGPPSSLLGEEICMAEQEYWMCLEHVLLDRITAISQRVYNPDPALDDIRSDNLKMLLSKFKPIVVYCRPSTDRLMRFENFTWRDGETEEHKQKILKRQHEFIDRYDAIMATIPHVLYDFDNPDSWVAVHRMMDAMNGDKGSYKWLISLTKTGRF